LKLSNITSKHNNAISGIKKLKNKKYREETGFFIVEGYRNLVDSLKVGIAKKIFFSYSFSENIDFLEKINCEIYKVPDSLFSEISDTKTPQGILGVFEIPKFDENKVLDKIIILNAVSDPGNVGTIFRTALATGFNTIILDELCADAYSNKVVRSAMSSVFQLNILRTNDLQGIIKKYKEQGFLFYAGALRENSIDLFDIKFNSKCAFVFGSEANGVEKYILDIADITYKITMSDKIESLNVAVAAGISMYESFRQINK
jgi:TrmH family RNA methyltransferase